MFFKIAGAPIGSPRFFGSKKESMACALRRYRSRGFRLYSVFGTRAYLSLTNNC
ncbi:MAG: hypothetical protein P8X79_08105 [Reinekea sp.]